MSNQDPKSIFIKALEWDSPEEMANFLDKECDDNPKLRASVEKLLAAHHQAGDFLGGVENSKSLKDSVSESTSALIGSQIGPYKILQEIGDGGFGVVYMAEQTEPVERRIALKIIKPGMDSREIIARFEAERQALALMDHPNIARVLDAGETQVGHPYFVMELVHGVPITEYADRNRLSMYDRLQIFMTVCRAVQHAHHKGIVHRDIKPTNVMVTLHDGQPVVKVIDFGIAKALNRKLTEKTLFTSYGQMIGTPQYMSPEQAEMSGLDVDTRSDVYSLGVLLYELLTGSTPLSEKNIRKAGFAEIQRLVSQHDAPRLSARLSTLGEELTIVAQHRSIEPKRLQRTVQGELDWIVLRALEKERGRRYETPSAFVADIQRYLANEPVEACPPSPVYKLKKFINRHRGWFFAVAAVLLALLIGLGAATYAFFLAQQRKQVAEKESARANEVVRVLNEMLESADPTLRPQNYTVREMLDDFATTLEGRFGDPQVEANVRHTVGRAYYHLGIYQAAEPQLRRALQLIRGQERGTREEAVLLTHLAEAIKASALVFDEPKRLLREAVEILKRRGDSPKKLANTYAILGWTLHHDRDNPSLLLSPGENEGVFLNREGLRLVEPITDAQSNLLKGRLHAGLAFELACSVEHKDIIAAEAHAKQAIDYLRAAPNALFHSMAYVALARCQMLLKKPVLAAQSYRLAIQLETQRRSSPDTTLYEFNMAMFQQGKFDEGIRYGMELTDPGNWPEVLPDTCIRGRMAIANVVLALGDNEFAEQILNETVELSESRLGSDHNASITARYYLGNALVSQWRVSERRAKGHTMMSSLLPMGRMLVQTERPALSTAFAYLVGNVESPRKKDIEVAIRANRQTLRLPLTPASRLRNLYADGLLHRKAGNPVEAMQRFREVIASPTAYTWNLTYAYAPFFLLRNAEDALAEMLIESGHVDQVERIYREAITRRQNVVAPDKYQILFAKLRLAEFFLEQEKQADSFEILDAISRDLEDCPKCFDWLRRRVDQLSQRPPA